MDYLDVALRIDFDDEHEAFKLKIAVYDGNLCVAWNEYYDTEMFDLFLRARGFYKHWTNLYFDRPGLTEPYTTRDGSIQLPLGI